MRVWGQPCNVVVSWPGATSIPWTQWLLPFSFWWPLQPSFQLYFSGHMAHLWAPCQFHSRGHLPSQWAPSLCAHQNGVVKRPNWMIHPQGRHPQGVVASHFPFLIGLWLFRKTLHGVTTFRGWRPKGVGMHPPEWIRQEAWGSLQNGMCQRPEWV